MHTRIAHAAQSMNAAHVVMKNWCSLVRSSAWPILPHWCRVPWLVVLLTAIPLPARAAEGTTVSVYPETQSIPAPHGHLILTAPALNSTVVKRVQESTNVKVSAYRDTSEGRFYVTDWSWQRYQAKSIKPNWVYIQTAPRELNTPPSAPGSSVASNPRSAQSAFAGGGIALPNGFQPRQAHGTVATPWRVCLMAEAGLAVAASKTLDVWSIKSGALLRSIPASYEVHNMIAIPGTTKVLSIEYNYREGGGLFEYELVTGKSTKIVELGDNGVAQAEACWERNVILVNHYQGEQYWVHVDRVTGRYRVERTTLPDAFSLALYPHDRGFLATCGDGRIGFLSPEGFASFGKWDAKIAWAATTPQGIAFTDARNRSWMARNDADGRTVKAPEPCQMAQIWKDDGGILVATPSRHRLFVEKRGDTYMSLGVAVAPERNAPPVWEYDNKSNQILVGHPDGGMQLLDAGDLRLLQRFSSSEIDSLSLDLSRDGRYITALKPGDKPFLFDLQTLSSTPVALPEKAVDVAFGTSPDQTLWLPEDLTSSGKILAFNSSSRSVGRLHVPGLATLASHQTIPQGIAARGEATVITFKQSQVTKDARAIIWTDTGHLVMPLREPCFSPAISRAGTQIALPGGLWGSKDFFFKLSENRYNHVQIDFEMPYFAASFSDDGRKVALTGLGGSDGAVGGVTILNTKDLTDRKLPVTIDDGTSGIQWRPGYNQIVYGGVRRYGNEQVYHLADAGSGKVLGTWRSDKQEGWPAGPVFSGDGSRLALHHSRQYAFDICGVSPAGKISIVGTLIRSSTSPEEWVIFCPDGYYAASPKGAREIFFVRGLDAYPFDEFDAKYNRPDIVMERLNPGSVLAKELATAHAYRLKKSGHNTGSNAESLEVKIISASRAQNGRCVIQSSSKTGRITLKNIRMYVNGVRIENSAAPITEHPDGSFVIDAPLVQGRNKIQVSAIAGDGTESRRDTALVMNSADDSLPDLYLASVGVAKYTGSIPRLTWTTKDCRDLVAALKAQEGKCFNKVHVKILTDDDATASNIAGLGSFFSQATHRDAVLLHLSGHGELSRGHEYEFLPVGAYFKDDVLVGGVGFAEIEALLKQSPALRRAIFMDTCHSGDLVDFNQASTIRDAGALEFLMQEYFSDIRRNSGITVLAAAGAAELAVEGGFVNDKPLENGLFTHFLLEAIKRDGGSSALSLNKLQSLIKDRLLASKASNQRPVFRAENPDMEFFIAAPSHIHRSQDGTQSGVRRQTHATASAVHEALQRINHAGSE